MTDLVTKVELGIEPATAVVLRTKTRIRVATASGAFCSVGESGFWFPVAPGTSTLPPPPEATTNPSPSPGNAVTLPPDFDDTDLCYLFQDLLPIGQPPVYPVELEPDTNYQPYEEVVPFVGVTVARLSIQEHPYALVLPTGVINAVVKAVLKIPTYILSAEAAAVSMSGQAAALKSSRKVLAAAQAFTLTGFGSGFIRDYLIGTNAGTFVATGQDAGLRYDRQPLVAEVGEFVLQGQDAGGFLGKTLTAEAGSFTLSGEAADLATARILAADGGEFSLTGSDARLSLDDFFASWATQTYVDEWLDFIDWWAD